MVTRRSGRAIFWGEKNQMQQTTSQESVPNPTWTAENLLARQKTATSNEPWPSFQPLKIHLGGNGGNWSLGPRSYRSRCSFPMTCHWMIGMQGSTPCPLCGLMCLWWEPAICAGWSAMIFTTYGRSDVPSMWGNIRPQWRLLQQHLETKGPGWYPLAEREERLFTNRSNRPGDDMKDELRTDSDPTAWRTWKYFTEPAMAATSASSTLRVSWWTRNAYQHVCPGSRGRTSHIAAVHL